MRHSLKTAFFLLLAGGRPPAGGAGGGHPRGGRVPGFADGPPRPGRPPGRTRHRIRLLGIDAPEHGQAFGERSKQSLARLTFRRQVSVDWQGRDAYGRILGRVRVAVADCPQSNCPKTLDANLEQVKRGLAWWNRKFADTQFPGDAGEYEAAERQARTARAGLWRERNPVPPWRWRYAKRAEQDRVKP